MSIEIDLFDESSSSDMGDNIVRIFTPRPHQHRKRFSISKISTRDSVTKIMKFRTYCAEMPSSWEVEFNLTKGAQFENFEMAITLRRIDNGQVPLQGYAIAFLSNSDHKVCPRSYCVDSKLPDFESADDSDVEEETTSDFDVDDHYKCLFTEGQETLPNDMLLIKTELLVMGCCGEDESETHDFLRIRKKSKESLYSQFRHWFFEYISIFLMCRY